VDATSKAWAIEGALNPTVLRIHVATPLTDRTILTCPPAPAPAPFDEVLGIDGVRSVDLQRYRARVNLAPGAGRGRVSAALREVLGRSWEAPSDLPAAEDPRAFACEHSGRRVVAESQEMAEGSPLLEAVFEVDGVAEAILGEGLMLVGLGRMFRWRDVEPAVRAAAGQ
jgi:hypothetical protein